MDKGELAYATQSCPSCGRATSIFVNFKSGSQVYTGVCGECGSFSIVGDIITLDGINFKLIDEDESDFSDLETPLPEVREPKGWTIEDKARYYGFRSVEEFYLVLGLDWEIE